MPSTAAALVLSCKRTLTTLSSRPHMLGADTFPVFSALPWSTAGASLAPARRVQWVREWIPRSSGGPSPAPSPARRSRLLEERGAGRPTVIEFLVRRSPRSLKEWPSEPIGNYIVAGGDVNAPRTVPHGHFVVERRPEARALKDLGVWTSVARCRIYDISLPSLSNPHIAHCFAAHLTLHSYFIVADYQHTAVDPRGRALAHLVL